MRPIGGITCEQLRETAPELALGILPARERAAAVAHLQRCPACRAYVRELVGTADGLVELIPGSEPPVGFESRVLRRIGLPPPRSRRRLRQRVALATAASAMAFAVGVGGWAVGRTADTPEPAAPAATAPAPAPGSSLATAPLAGQGQAIGRAFVYTGSSPWAYVSVDSDTAASAIDGTVWCQIQRADGSSAMIGSFRISDGYAQWGGAYRAGHSPVTGLRLLTADGTVLAATPRTGLWQTVPARSAA